jgi:mono/diheme cytochrome c family protein
MKLSERWPALLVIAVLGVGVASMVADLFSPSDGAARVAVVVPKLSALAVSGKDAFDVNCAQCHGANGSGTDFGPPLVHDIYNPGHHGDESFYIAASRGVDQHHWPYGDMAPQPQVTGKEMAAIIQYVRELQLANGITYRPHRM